MSVELAGLPALAHAEPTPLPAVTDDPPPSSNDRPAGDQVDRAMSAYQRGTQNYNLAQYEAALADFKEAASLYASADFQYNIALCYEKLGKYEEAIRAYVTYLKAKPDAEDRPNVENRIRELQLEIELDAQEAARRKKDEEANRPPQPDPGEEKDPPPAGNGRVLIITGATLTGLGAAVALGGGIGFGVLASDASSVVDEIQTGGNPQELTFAEAQLFDEDGKRYEALQVGLVAGGSVLAVTGAVLLAVGLRKRKASRARPQAWLGPFRGTGRAAGLSLSGRF